MSLCIGRSAVFVVVVKRKTESFKVHLFAALLPQTKQERCVYFQLISVLMGFIPSERSFHLQPKMF